MISICMPYWQRQELLDQSLAAYRRLYDDMDLEICIVDDGSPRPVNAPGCRVTHLPIKRCALNPCTPINQAVNMATADIIVLTNPEIEHRERILPEMCSRLLDQGENAYLTAACVDGDGKWLAHSSIKGGIEGRGPMPDGAQFHFCAMFYRSLWDKAGGFDEEYRDGQAFDDNDWLWRLEDAGARFCHCDDLVVHHHKTGTRWPYGGWALNARRLNAKWGHKWL
jgi:GT2 family glycosyltransferase